MAEWVRVAELAEVREGHPVLATVAGEDVSLFRVGDEVFALEDLCSHAEASLSEGEQRSFCITCPQHGGQFDVRTGAAIHFPAFSPVRTYPTQIRDGQVFVSA